MVQHCRKCCITTVCCDSLRYSNEILLVIKHAALCWDCWLVNAEASRVLQLGSTLPEPSITYVAPFAQKICFLKYVTKIGLHPQTCIVSGVGIHDDAWHLDPKVIRFMRVGVSSPQGRKSLLLFITFMLVQSDTQSVGASSWEEPSPYSTSVAKEWCTVRYSIQYPI